MITPTTRLLMVSAMVTFNIAPVFAHEFWLAPKNYIVEANTQIIAELRVGQMLRGTEFPYLTSSIQAFTITTRNNTGNVKGFEGDIPALSYTATEPGLHIIAYHSTASMLTHKTWEKFLKYLSYEGLDEIANAHQAQNLPESNFTEAFIRCAKTLVQVGPISPQDKDKPLGLPFELVAENNPFKQGLKTLKVTLLRLGKPVAGRQVALFRNDGTITRNLFKTDMQGQVKIPIMGAGTFLLSATDLQPVQDSAVVWESHWASLSFGFPKASSDQPIN